MLVSGGSRFSGGRVEGRTTSAVTRVYILFTGDFPCILLVELKLMLLLLLLGLGHETPLFIQDLWFSLLGIVITSAVAVDVIFVVAGCVVV